MVTFHHFSCPPYLLYRDNTITVRLAITGEKSALPTEIQLWCYPSNEPAVVPMIRILEKDSFAVFSGEAVLDPSYNQQSYTFRALFPDGSFLWIASKLESINEPLAQDRFTVSLHESDCLWMREEIFYRIEPGFFASHTANDQEFSAGTGGGTFQGIAGKLDYVSSMGFTGICLGSVLPAATPGGSGCLDYRETDPALGSAEDLAALSGELHRRGMKLIADLQMNHVSADHPWFDRQDRTGSGACHHEDSPSRKFFTFRDGSPVYWHDDNNLLKLDYSCRELQEIMFRSPDSVVASFLRPPLSADGLCLRSAHMIGGHGSANGNMYYLHEIFAAARKINPASCIICEHQYDARPWLSSALQQEESALNICGFYMPMFQFLTGLDFRTGKKIKYRAEDFREFIDRYHSGISHDKLCSMLNVVSTRETGRIAGMLKGNPQLIRVALTMMYTWIGSPCVLYGDEIGMAGDSADGAPLVMDWKITRDLYRKLITTLARFRKDNQVITKGTLAITHASGTILVYERSFDLHRTIVIINSGNSVSSVDLTRNVESLRIQEELSSFDASRPAPVKNRYNVRGSLIMDNIRVMSIGELDSRNKVSIGPTSALIIQS